MHARLRSRRVPRPAAQMANPSEDAGPSAPPMKRRVYDTATVQQTESPFFTVIPAEIRNTIFDYALTDYEDMTASYDMDTCYRRPGLMGPRRTWTALLRTCKQIYSETWYLPWTNSRHIVYFAWNQRKPPKTTEQAHIQHFLYRLYDAQGEVSVDHVQIFAQLCFLQEGRRFSQICNMQRFHPRRITVTIRHTDWWNWEDDRALCIGSVWVQNAHLPRSLQEMAVEFESLARRSAQVDSIAGQAARTWVFRQGRKGTKYEIEHSSMPFTMTGDDKEETAMVADPSEVITTRWTGSSTWEGKRWERDEVRPNEVDYYIRTVVWRRAPKGYSGQIGTSGQNELQADPATIGPTPRQNGDDEARVAAGTQSVDEQPVFMDPDEDFMDPDLEPPDEDLESVDDTALGAVVAEADRVDLNQDQDQSAILRRLYAQMINSRTRID